MDHRIYSKNEKGKNDNRSCSSKTTWWKKIFNLLLNPLFMFLCHKLDICLHYFMLYLFMGNDITGITYYSSESVCGFSLQVCCAAIWLHDPDYYFCNIHAMFSADKIYFWGIFMTCILHFIQQLKLAMLLFVAAPWGCMQRLVCTYQCCWVHFGYEMPHDPTKLQTAINRKTPRKCSKRQHL